MTSIRLVNISAAVVKVNVYFTRLTAPAVGNANATPQPRRRQISPIDTAIAAGCVYIDDDEIVLEAGDRIQAKADTAKAIHYHISGVEVDV